MDMKYYGGGSAKKIMKTGGAKPDFLDLDGDGNRTEPMKNTYGTGGAAMETGTYKYGGSCGKKMRYNRKNKSF